MRTLSQGKVVLLIAFNAGLGNLCIDLALGHHISAIMRDCGIVTSLAVFVTVAVAWATKMRKMTA